MDIIRVVLDLVSDTLTSELCTTTHIANLDLDPVSPGR